jgi:serine/threonine-protein kinase
METRKIGDKDTKPVAPFGTQPEIKLPLKQTSYDGVLLKDRYVIEGELGRGGIGVVYLARDMQLLQRRVVVKVLLQETENSMHTPWFKKKFDQEIEALARLDHPGIVGVLDAGAMPDGKPFFVMQFVEGVTLRSEMKGGPMEFARVARIVRQIGNALGAAHDKGIIHRDLKPENVMVQQIHEGEEIIKLIDFGIATVKDSQVATAAERTKVAGAFPYMAPEQLRGQPEVTSDVWALGVIAYEMITGRLPFVADTLVQLHELQRQGPEIGPAQLRRDLPAEAEQVILKAISFNPGERYASARHLSDDLACALTGDRALRAAEMPAAMGRSVGAPAMPSAPTQIEGGDGLYAEPSLESKPSAIAGKPSAKMLLATAVLAITITGVLIWLSQRVGTTDQQTPQTLIASPRSLNYSIRVRLNPEKYPNQATAQLAGEIIFSPGDELCFNLSSAQDGYLYIINEGPQPANGLPLYNVLFPDPKLISAGAPSLKANQQLFIPSEQPPWFPVDEEQGTEKLWLVWSERPIAVMETARKWLNERDGGEIKDADETRAVQQFLNQNYSASRPVAERGEHQTYLKGGRDGVLVYPVKLEHR